MTKHKFRIPAPGGHPGETSELTSLVMDEAEFEAFVQHIADGDPVVNVRTGSRMSPEDVEALRKAKHVPMVSRGTKTEYLFKIYEVDTDLLSAVIRGQGEKIFSQLVGN